MIPEVSSSAMSVKTPCTLTSHTVLLPHISSHTLSLPHDACDCLSKECGLEKFVSKSLRESMKGKDLKRMLAQYLKMNQSLAAPGQKQLTALQAKLHYMKIISELKTFGSRVFMVTLLVCFLGLLTCFLQSIIGRSVNEFNLNWEKWGNGD